MAFETLFIIILGLIMGSFLNVLIYRVPLGISLFNPKRSQCTHCNSTIEWYENIPIISYILLKGRCSKCKEKISIFYPLVEVITAMVTLSLYKKIGLTSEFIFVLIIFYLLIVLSFIDFRYKAVPDSLLVLVTSITLLYLIVNKPEHLSTFFIFAGGIIILELFISYYIQNIKATLTKDDSLRDQKALGEGDVPIVAIIGGVLGLQFGLIAIFLSAILAIIPSLISRLYKKDIETPFVPYLSLGFFITYIGTQSILKILEGLNIV